MIVFLIDYSLVSLTGLGHLYQPQQSGRFTDGSKFSTVLKRQDRCRRLHTLFKKGACCCLSVSHMVKTSTFS